MVNDRFVFEHLKRYDHSLSIRGEVSVILFDQDNKMIGGEFYLSNYHEEDISKEIYITRN